VRRQTVLIWALASKWEIPCTPQGTNAINDDIWYSYVKAIEFWKSLLQSSIGTDLYWKKWIVFVNKNSTGYEVLQALPSEIIQQVPLKTWLRNSKEQSWQKKVNRSVWDGFTSVDELCCWNIWLFDWLISSKVFWAGTGNIYAADSYHGNWGRYVRVTILIAESEDSWMRTSQRQNVIAVKSHFPHFIRKMLWVLYMINTSSRTSNCWWQIDECHTLKVCQHCYDELASNMSRNESLRGLSNLNSNL